MIDKETVASYGKHFLGYFVWGMAIAIFYGITMNGAIVWETNTLWPKVATFFVASAVFAVLFMAHEKFLKFSTKWIKNRERARRMFESKTSGRLSLLCMGVLASIYAYINLSPRNRTTVIVFFIVIALGSYATGYTDGKEGDS